MVVLSSYLEEVAWTTSVCPECSEPGCLNPIIPGSLGRFWAGLPIHGRLAAREGAAVKGDV